MPHEPIAASPGTSGMRPPLDSRIPGHEAMDRAKNVAHPTGPMSEQTQTITWTETLTWPPQGRRGTRSAAPATPSGTASPAAPFAIPGSTR